MVPSRVLVRASARVCHLGSINRCSCHIAALDLYIQQLHLQVKDNWQVFPLNKRGLDFVGYVFHPGYTKLRKRIKINFKRKARRKKKRVL